MKKVLFIIQSYPSNKSANVLCDEKIIKAMVDNGGYDVHCLVYRFHGQKLYEEINGVKVHRFNRGKWWNLYTYARDNDNQLFCRVVVRMNFLYMRIRQLLCIPIYPNYEPILAKLVANEAIKLHNKEHFDLVVAEHNGRDTLYAGAQLKKIDKSVKLVSILWDPFSGKDLAKYLPASYANYMMLKDEDKILKYSDRIICMRSCKSYQEKYSSSKSFYHNIRFLDIPGIVRPTLVPQNDGYTRKGMINMLYSGVISFPDRDPSALIEILNLSKYSDKINLIFFVTCPNGLVKVKKIFEKFTGEYIVHEYIPKKQIDYVALNSDVLINIGGPNPRMIPSKIFEYMSLGKPIYSTYYIDNDSSKVYLDKYPIALCTDIRKSVVDLVSVFDSFVARKLHTKVPFEDVERRFPLNTPEEYINTFEELF